MKIGKPPTRWFLSLVIIFVLWLLAMLSPAKTYNVGLYSKSNLSEIGIILIQYSEVSGGRLPRLRDSRDLTPLDYHGDVT